MTIGASTAVLGLTALGLMVGPASATTTTTGAWVLSPAQSVSTSAPTTTTSSVYHARPVKAARSRSWPWNRGVVRVQFTLWKATKTTTTTTTTTGPVVFQSLHAAQGTGTPGQEYSNLIFTPNNAMTLQGITNLSADFKFTTGDCYGGSIRWIVVVNHNGADVPIDVYYGTRTGGGPFTGCQSSTLSANMVGGTANVELNNTGVYGSWATALGQYGSDPVEWAGLVLDGGWVADQVVTLNSAAVNDNTWTPLPAGTTTSPSSTTGAYTCDPDETAYIHVYKVSSTGSILANMPTFSPGRRHNTGIFRHVHGKYVYDLALRGYRAGRYEVVMRIGGNTPSNDISSPAYFRLR